MPQCHDADMFLSIKSTVCDSAHTVIEHGIRYPTLLETFTSLASVTCRTNTTCHPLQTLLDTDQVRPHIAWCPSRLMINGEYFVYLIV